MVFNILYISTITNMLEFQRWSLISQHLQAPYSRSVIIARQRYCIFHLYQSTVQSIACIVQ